MGERKHILEARRNSPSYEEDYAGWLEAQVVLMRADRWESVDKDNLLDEVASLGRSDFKGFVSAIEIVLLHMLKWDHQPERRSPSWAYSILEHRRRITQELTDSPSYKSRIQEAVERAYETAPAAAARETGLPLRTFPESCPYSWADITERSFSPPQ